MQPLQVQHGGDDGARIMRRPMVRRTVDHAGPGLKMIKDRIFRPELRHAPVTMPSTEKAVREMLPPAACRSNATSGICSRFVHTSSNKDRCPVNHVCWTPESRRLLASTANGMFTLWSGLSFNFETTQQAHEVAIRTSVWSHNGEWMISGDNAGLLKYWQPTLNNVKEIDAHAGVPVRELSFCPTDAKFCTCSDDGTVKVWDFETAKLDRLMPGTGVDMGKSHSWDVKTVQVPPLPPLVHPSIGAIARASRLCRRALAPGGRQSPRPRPRPALAPSLRPAAAPPPFSSPSTREVAVVAALTRACFRALLHSGTQTRRC